MKRFVSVTAILVTVCLALTGCYGMYGPQPTTPPEVTFSSVQEFTDAVAKAKADTSAQDQENLKGIAHYYSLQTLPENAAVSSIMVAAEAVRVRYAFGLVSEDTFDNQLEIGWYRTVDVSNFMNNMSQTITNSGLESDTIKSGDLTYLRMIPTVNIAVTPSPGVTPAATPTPRSTKYCQFVYWVQDGAAFVAAVPLGFTNDDIIKYCRAQKIELGQ